MRAVVFCLWSNPVAMPSPFYILSGLVPFFSLPLSLAFTFTPTGQTVELDGIPYYIPAQPVTTIQTYSPLHRKAQGSGGLTPLTVVSTTGSSYGSSDLDATIANFTKTDDVFSAGFLEAVYVQYTGAKQYGGHRGGWGKPGIGANGTQAVYSSSVGADDAVPPGPYFMSSSGAVYEVRRTIVIMWLFCKNTG